MIQSSTYNIDGKGGHKLGQTLDKHFADLLPKLRLSCWKS